MQPQFILNILSPFLEHNIKLEQEQYSVFWIVSWSLALQIVSFRGQVRNDLAVGSGRLYGLPLC